MKVPLKLTLLKSVLKEVQDKKDIGGLVKPLLKKDKKKVYVLSLLLMK